MVNVNVEMNESDRNLLQVFCCHVDRITDDIIEIFSCKLHYDNK